MWQKAFLWHDVTLNMQRLYSYGYGYAIIAYCFTLVITRSLQLWGNRGTNMIASKTSQSCLRAVDRLTAWWRHQMEIFSALLAIYAGNSPVTGEFPVQRASNAENISIWWRHHDNLEAWDGLTLVFTLVIYLSSILDHDQAVYGIINLFQKQILHWSRILNQFVMLRKKIISHRSRGIFNPCIIWWFHIHGQYDKHDTCAWTN